MKKAKVGDLFDPSMEGEDPKKIAEALDGIAYDVKEQSYTKPLSTKELNARRKEFAKNSIDIATINTEIKNFSDAKKSEMKPLVKENAKLIEEIKGKSEYIYGKLFEVENREAKVMEVYNTEGICVEVRAMTAKEKKNLKIFSIVDESNTGTNGEQ